MDTKEFLIERLILKTGNRINNIRNDDLKSSGLTSAQSETILYYSDHAGSNIKELAVHLKVTHQAARKLVDKLKSKGILEALVSREDKRYMRVFLTEEGKALCRELKKSGSSTGAGILEGFSESDREKLLEYMRRVEVNIDRL